MCIYYVIIRIHTTNNKSLRWDRSRADGHRRESAGMCSGACSGVHPVSITRFPLRRFSPGAGLLRYVFCHREWLRFSRGWVQKDGNLLTETGCIESSGRAASCRTALTPETYDHVSIIISIIVIIITIVIIPELRPLICCADMIIARVSAVASAFRLYDQILVLCGPSRQARISSSRPTFTHNGEVSSTNIEFTHKYRVHG